MYPKKPVFMGLCLLFADTHAIGSQELTLANVVINGTSIVDEAKKANQHPAPPDAQQTPMVVPDKSSAANAKHGAEAQALTKKNLAPKLKQPIRHPVKLGQLPCVGNGPEKKTRCELHGYINGKYGRFSIEQANDQQFVGYWFDSKGNRKNINGEWVNGTLQVYDTAGNRSALQINQTEPQTDNGTTSNQDAKFLEKLKDIQNSTGK